jgi:hypothetical protein
VRLQGFAASATTLASCRADHSPGEPALDLDDDVAEDRDLERLDPDLLDVVKLVVKVLLLVFKLVLVIEIT